jgi:arylsulfatase A-like enzyme
MVPACAKTIGKTPRNSSSRHHIRPGTVKSDIFASLDWLPT